jgi:serine carboxypeptidase-like clade 2
VANVIFVDAPPGVGFSHDAPGLRTVWNDTTAARFNYEFMSGFLELRPRLKGRPFYITGESYAGHFAPQLAALIVTDGVGVRGDDHKMPVKVSNAAVLKTMFRGLMAGNPCTGAVGKDTDWCLDGTDPTIGAFRAAHAFASVDSAIPTDTAAFPEWALLFRLCGGDPGNTTARTRQPGPEGPAATLPPPAAATVFVPWEYGPCSNAFLTAYLNRADVAAALHADANMTWSLFSDIKYPTPPSTRGVIPEYAHLMNHTNASLLLYSGDNDAVVNFLQTQTVVLYGFGRERRSNFTPWYHRDEFVEGWWQHAGYFIEFDRVTWASVKGAGHMVPQYRPAAAHALLTAFLTGGLRPQEQHPATIAPAPAGAWPPGGLLAPEAAAAAPGADGVAPWLVAVAALLSASGGAAVATAVSATVYRRRIARLRMSSLLQADDDNAEPRRAALP